MWTKQRSATALLTVFVAVVTACDRPAEEAEWGGTTVDSAGITIVRNPVEGLWSSTNRWRVEQQLTIGSSEGDPDYEFGQIAGIAVAQDGRIYVFDQQAQQMKVFDSDGVFLSTIGGPGGGPGEFAAGAGPVILGAGDTLFVPDLGNRRVDRFTLDGGAAGSYVLDILAGIPIRWDVTSSGMIVNQMRPLPNPERPASDTMDVVVIRDGAGAAVDTLIRVPSGKTFTTRQGQLPEFHFFSPEPAWAIGDGQSMYFGINNEYRIRYYDHAGKLVRILSRDFERQAVTDRDQRIFNDFLERAWVDAGVPQEILAALQANVHFAENYPAYLQFMSGPAGSLWVQQVQRLSDLTDDEADNFNPLLSLGGDDWDVFDSSGRYLGRIQMPARFQPMRFIGTDIYGIWLDEFDVQYVLKVGVVGVPGGDA